MDVSWTATLCRVTDHDLPSTTSRSTVSTAVCRAAAISLGAALGSLALPAAATPGAWADTDNPSLLVSLLIIGVPVLAIIAVVALLTYLPSMMGRGGSGDTGHGDPEWFGGRRGGVEAGDQQVAEGSGGTGARW